MDPEEERVWRAAIAALREGGASPEEAFIGARLALEAFRRRRGKPPGNEGPPRGGSGRDDGS